MLDTAGFKHHAGPLRESAPGQIQLTLAPQHLNVSGRMHGAMMMIVLTAAAEGKAKAELPSRGPDQTVQLVCADFGFVRSAQPGSHVIAQAQMARATRTLMFLNAQVLADGDTLCTATLTFAIVPRQSAVLAWPATPQAHPSPDVALRKPSNLLGETIGPIYQHERAAGRMRTQFEVTARRCRPDAAELDDGMTLYVADSLGSRTANTSSGQLCVTVNLQMRRFASAPAGAWVDLETQTRHVQGDLVFVDGQFSVAGQPLADFSGIWTGMGARKG